MRTPSAPRLVWVGVLCATLLAMLRPQSFPLYALVRKSWVTPSDLVRGAAGIVMNFFSHKAVRTAAFLELCRMLDGVRPYFSFSQAMHLHVFFVSPP